ncbi:MAG TPA: phosphoglucosamine mutase [Bacteroidota bacterium]|nr:phosphoglucosamine mutase [Bacteroidota bacterium]
MSLMVSISGIRGIVGESLTPEVVVRYASAFAEYCHGGTIVLGRDGRITGSSVAHIVSSTLLQMGCDVASIGVCPTPTVALGVEKLRASGGIAVTASHNPIQWNGLKFIAPNGMFLDSEENRKFWEIAGKSERSYRSWEKQGKHSAAHQLIDEHIRAVLAIPYLHSEKIRKRRLKVVLDCVNAAGGVIIPRLLREFGCDVVEMNTDVSGIFAHTPEPVPENLTGLSSRVVSEKADVGIAVDPDVDRLVFIDERGVPFVEEYTIASAVKYVLDAEKKLGRAGHSVVVNLSTTRAVDDIAKEYGATVTRTPVGEINVASRMKVLRSVIGGEGSGGVIFPAVHYGRDAAVGIGLFLQLLVDFGGKTSELKASLPYYTIVKSKIELGSLKPEPVLARLAAQYSKTEKTNSDDGLKIDFRSSWVHLRKSNTEPIMRVIAEAPTRDEAAALVERFQKEILS